MFEIKGFRGEACRSFLPRVAPAQARSRYTTNIYKTSCCHKHLDDLAVVTNTQKNQLLSQTFRKTSCCFYFTIYIVYIFIKCVYQVSISIIEKRYDNKRFERAGVFPRRQITNLYKNTAVVTTISKRPSVYLLLFIKQCQVSI